MITSERAPICCLKKANGALKPKTVVLDEINQDVLSHNIWMTACHWEFMSQMVLYAIILISLIKKVASSTHIIKIVLQNHFICMHD